MQMWMRSVSETFGKLRGSVRSMMNLHLILMRADLLRGLSLSLDFHARLQNLSRMFPIIAAPEAVSLDCEALK